MLEYDDVVVGILAGLLVALAILVYVVVAWAGVQMFDGVGLHPPEGEE